MLELGADVNEADETRYYANRPLAAAAKAGRPEIVAALLARGADPSTPSPDKDALHYATESGDEECVRLLQPTAARVV